PYRPSGRRWPTSRQRRSRTARPRARAAIAPLLARDRDPRRRRAPAPRPWSSRRPGELGRRESRLPLVLDAERADARALRLSDGEIGPGGVEHAVEPDRLAGLHSERNDVLDLEVDSLSD